jgi:hypothetical protein
MIVVATACIALPLEHTNYYDPDGSSRLVIVGSRDTLNSIGEVLALTAESTPELPSAAPGVAWAVMLGGEVVQVVGTGQYQVRPTAGLLPVIVRIRAYVPPAATSPEDTVTIVVRQRPTTLDLVCPAPTGCENVTGLTVTRTLTFQALDSLANAVNLPAGAFRYGTVTSRDPAVVSIVDRPEPNSVRVRSESVGATWIVLAGDGVADSVMITVTP